MIKVYLAVFVKMFYGVFLLIAGLYTAWVIYGGLKLAEVICKL